MQLNRITDSGNTAFDSDQLLADGKVVIFALPGAFTPTCSAAHLPGFIGKADELKAAGVDHIVCLSVNDAWVMDVWGHQQDCLDRIDMIGDGSANFTRAIGMELDRMSAGMGIRSRRYAMVLNNGIVELFNVENDGEFQVSDATTVLNHLRN